MVWTLILNGATGFVMIVTFAFCVGDIDKVMASTTGFAFIQVFLNSTGSVPAATAMTVVIMVMQFCATISNVATTSRQIYSFARDKGVPFSSFFSQVAFPGASRSWRDNIGLTDRLGQQDIHRTTERSLRQLGDCFPSVLD